LIISFPLKEGGGRSGQQRRGRIENRSMCFLEMVKKRSAGEKRGLKPVNKVEMCKERKSGYRIVPSTSSKSRWEQFNCAGMTRSRFLPGGAIFIAPLGSAKDDRKVVDTGTIICFLNLKVGKRSLLPGYEELKRKNSTYTRQRSGRPCELTKKLRNTFRGKKKRGRFSGLRRQKPIVSGAKDLRLSFRGKRGFWGTARSEEYEGNASRTLDRKRSRKEEKKTSEKKALH